MARRISSGWFIAMLGPSATSSRLSFVIIVAIYRITCFSGYKNVLIPYREAPPGRAGSFTFLFVSILLPSEGLPRLRTPSDFTKGSIILIMLSPPRGISF